MRREYTGPELDFIRLARIDGVGAATFFRIFAEFPDLEYFFSDMHRNIEKMGKRIRPQAAESIRQNLSASAFQDFMDALDKKGISAVALNSPEYPLYLREIRFPPPVLYVKGTLENLSDRTIGIVGTRRCTRRGYGLSHDVARELAENGVTVVSGMARGIDSAAHTGALDGGGVTAAVLGSGVDVVYPPENDRLYQRILEKGAVISEYVPGTGPLAQNFPARNRIISGMSRGIYVVESSKKGGAGITVDYAMNQGRDVFAATGGAFDKAYELTNALCESGCPQVFEAGQILDAYGWRMPAKKGGSLEFSNIQLDFLEQEIYNLLLTGDMGSEELSGSLEVPQQELNIALTMLEIKGVVRRLPGLLYGLS
jgi:DNA processing protein